MVIVIALSILFATGLYGNDAAAQKRCLPFLCSRESAEANHEKKQFHLILSDKIGASVKKEVIDELLTHFAQHFTTKNCRFDIAKCDATQVDDLAAIVAQVLKGAHMVVAAPRSMTNLFLTKRILLGEKLLSEKHVTEITESIVQETQKNKHLYAGLITNCRSSIHVNPLRVSLGEDDDFAQMQKPQLLPQKTACRLPVLDLSPKANTNAANDLKPQPKTIAIPEYTKFVMERLIMAVSNKLSDENRKIDITLCDKTARDKITSIFADTLAAHKMMVQASGENGRKYMLIDKAVLNSDHLAAITDDIISLICADKALCRRLIHQFEEHYSANPHVLRVYEQQVRTMHPDIDADDRSAVG